MRKLLAWWIRLHRLGIALGRRRAHLAYRAFRDARQARADVRALEHLDRRMLKDVGLESWAFALRSGIVERRREMARWSNVRLGMY